MIRKYTAPKYLAVILPVVAWLAALNCTFFADGMPYYWIIVGAVPAILVLSYLIFDSGLFLYSILFFIPLSVRTNLPGGATISIPSEALAVIMLCYFLAKAHRLRIPDKKILSHPVTLLLGIQILWLIVSSGLSSLPLVAFKRSFIIILYIVVFYWLFLSTFDKPGNIFKFYLFFAAGLVIPILNGFIRHTKYNFTHESSYNMPKPFFSDHTLYGATLAFIIPFLFFIFLIPNDYNRSLKQKTFYGILLVLCLVAEFFAYSRAAWLSLLITPFFLLLFRFRVRLIPMLAGVIVVFTILFLNYPLITEYMRRNEAKGDVGSLAEHVESISNLQTDISNRERINRWKCAIRMFMDKPVTGFGPGTYQFNYYAYENRNEMTWASTFHGNKGHAHSEYLGALCETGFPGFLIFVSTLVMILYTALKIIYTTRDKKLRNLTLAVILCLITFYFHGFFNGFLDNDKIAALFYGSLAAITALDVYFFREGTKDSGTGPAEETDTAFIKIP